MLVFLTSITYIDFLTIALRLFSSCFLHYLIVKCLAALTKLKTRAFSRCDVLIILHRSPLCQHFFKNFSTFSNFFCIFLSFPPQRTPAFVENHKNFPRRTAKSCKKHLSSKKHLLRKKRKFFNFFAKRA